MPAATFSRVVPSVGNAWRSAKKAICRLREVRYASVPMLSAAACCCTALTTELSISLLVAAVSTTISARSGLRVLDNILRDARIVRIDQYGNSDGTGKKLV